MNQIQPRLSRQKSFTLKQKNKHSKKGIKIVLSAFLCFFYFLVSAETPQKNYLISSKSAVLNQLQQKASYTGDVAISHDKFTIKGDNLEISYDEGVMKELFITGLPLIYEENPIRKSSEISIKALQMAYQVENNQLNFRGNVELRRNSDTVTADSLNYNLDTQELSAASNDKNEPVRLTINSLPR